MDRADEEKREREKADRGKKVEAGKKAKEAKRYSKKKPAKMKKKQRTMERKTKNQMRITVLYAGQTKLPKKNYKAFGRKWFTNLSIQTSVLYVG